MYRTAVRVAVSPSYCTHRRLPDDECAAVPFQPVPWCTYDKRRTATFLLFGVYLIHVAYNIAYWYGDTVLVPVPGPVDYGVQLPVALSQSPPAVLHNKKSYSKWYYTALIIIMCSTVYIHILLTLQNIRRMCRKHRMEKEHQRLILDASRYRYGTYARPPYFSCTVPVQYQYRVLPPRHGICQIYVGRHPVNNKQCNMTILYINDYVIVRSADTY